MTTITRKIGLASAGAVLALGVAAGLAMKLAHRHRPGRRDPHVRGPGRRGALIGGCNPSTTAG